MQYPGPFIGSTAYPRLSNRQRCSSNLGAASLTSFTWAFDHSRSAGTAALGHNRGTKFVSSTCSAHMAGPLPITNASDPPPEGHTSSYAMVMQWQTSYQSAQFTYNHGITRNILRQVFKDSCSIFVLILLNIPLTVGLITCPLSTKIGKMR